MHYLNLTLMWNIVVLELCWLYRKNTKICFILDKYGVEFSIALIIALNLASISIALNLVSISIALNLVSRSIAFISIALNFVSISIALNFVSISIALNLVAAYSDYTLLDMCMKYLHAHVKYSIIWISCNLGTFETLQCIMSPTPFLYTLLTRQG